MYLGAHILLPEGFDTHQNVKYPLAIYHGHFPSDLSGFSTTPPNPNLIPVMCGATNFAHCFATSKSEVSVAKIIGAFIAHYFLVDAQSQQLHAAN